MVSGIGEGKLENNAGTLVSLESHRDSRGLLCVVQGWRDIPFEVKRVYWISGVPEGESRGGHAHRRQYRLLVAVAGAFTVELERGDLKETFRLDSPVEGLIVSPGVWTTLHSFSADAVCMVVSSGEYDPGDYIRDHGEFLKSKD